MSNATLTCCSRKTQISAYIISLLLVMMHACFLVLPRALNADTAATPIAMHHLSLLLSVYLTLYFIMQVPLSIVMEVVGIRVMLVYSSITMIIGLLIFAISTRIDLFVISRIIMAFGASVSFVTALHIARECFGLKRYTFFIGLTEFIFLVAMAAAPIVIHVLPDHYGWRIIPVVLAVFLFFVFTWAFFLPKIQYVKSYVTIGGDLKKMFSVFRNKKVILWMVLIVIMGGLFNVHFEVINEMYAPILFAHYYHLHYMEGLVYNNYALLGYMAGCFLIGFFNRYFRSSTLFFFGALASVVIYIVGMITYHDVGVVLFVILAFFSSFILYAFRFFEEAADVHSSSMVIASINVVVNILPLILLPFIITSFSQPVLYLEGFVFSCYMVSFILAAVAILLLRRRR